MPNNIYGTSLWLGANGNYDTTNPGTTTPTSTVFKVGASGDIETAKSITLVAQSSAPSAADGKMFYYDGVGMSGEGLYVYYGGSWKKISAS